MVNNVALFIYYTPSWQQLADVVLPVAAAYCDKHGYAKVFIKHPFESSTKPIGYHKMHRLRDLMDRVEYIWVLDCDAMITGNQPVTNFISSWPYDMYFTSDVHGLNAGSWIVKSTEWSKDIIDDVLNNFDAPEEQSVIKSIIQYPSSSVCQLPHPSINSYLYTEYMYDWDRLVGNHPMPTHEQGNWQPGDMVLHLPGVDFERRIEIFKQVKEMLGL